MTQPCTVNLLYCNVKMSGFLCSYRWIEYSIRWCNFNPLFSQTSALVIYKPEHAIFYYSNSVRRKWRHQLNLRSKNPPSRKHPGFTPPSWIWPWKPLLPAQTLRAHPYPPYETTSQRNTRRWIPRQLNFD